MVRRNPSYQREKEGQLQCGIQSLLTLNVHVPLLGMAGSSRTSNGG